MKPPNRNLILSSLMVTNPAYEDLFANDQLIVSFLLVSMNECDNVVFSSCDTSHKLWQTIVSKYENTSRAHVMFLENQLQRSHMVSLTITEF